MFSIINIICRLFIVIVIIVIYYHYCFYYYYYYYCCCCYNYYCYYCHHYIYYDDDYCSVLIIIVIVIIIFKVINCFIFYLNAYLYALMYVYGCPIYLCDGYLFNALVDRADNRLINGFENLGMGIYCRHRSI